MVLAIPEDEKQHYEDILGSGGIFRRVFKRGEGAQPEFGEEVTVRFTERRLDTDAVISQDQVRQFRIGDGEVMPALELAAKMMREGDAHEVRCDARFAYGDKGLEGLVPPATPLKLFVELLRVGKRLTADMTPAELLVEAEKKKDSGNRYFRELKYDQAAKMYKKALTVLEGWERGDDGDADADAQAAKCKELLIALGNNVANVQHRLDQRKEARQSSLEVLQLDPQNLKALYRLAQLALDGGDFDDAATFVKQAVAVDPSSAKFREMLAQIKHKKEAHRAREKELFAKLGQAKHARSSAAASSDGPSDAAAAARALQEAPWRRVLRENVATVATVLTALIAFLMYEFLGKRYHEM
ncbi:hypothetical protein P43SY_005672 [Pythium insidiosum]|uniref:peptidylprolyl isomerase n=1 Tax=Pythium insidiosum TaxID=114742 RepID=A0AAD5LXK1_PYTIN|nr:hypothetical protein P43SY_005672 [Pythium insidiosum]